MAPPAVIPPQLQFVQSVDRLLGPVLTRLMPGRVRERGMPLRPLSAHEVRHVLIIRPGGLGDALLCWPMLNALRAAWPKASLEILAERRNAAAFELGLPTVGGSNPPLRIVCYDESSWRAIHTLTRTPYDVIIDTEQYHHLSTLLANHLRPRWLCGFATLGRERLLTHPVPHAEYTYEARAFLQLAGVLTGSSEPFDTDAPFLAAPADAREWAASCPGASGPGEYVVLFPVAGGAHRMWAADRFATVACELAGNGYRVLLLGGADGREAAARIVANSPGVPIVDLCGQTTLVQTAALLERARLSISADTGVLHLAYGVGTPTVALFGPGRHTQWAPPGRRHRVVRLGLPCSPCMRGGRFPACPIDIACLRDLDTGPVLAAARELLD